MSPPLVLIVSGSRTLATRPGGEDWARTQIARAMDDLSLDGEVVSGGAAGPDFWAIREGRARWREWRVFEVDGTILDRAGAEACWCDPADRDPDPYRRPLQRNKAMIAAYAGRPDVLVLGLVDPQSRTHGTDHTLTAARKAGLRCERRVCP